MQDSRGIYYYPLPENKKIKMYVRSNDDVVEFRLHNDDDPELWNEHGWITFEVAKKAASQYKGKSSRNPLDLYDFEVALNVLNDHNKS